MKKISLLSRTHWNHSDCASSNKEKHVDDVDRIGGADDADDVDMIGGADDAAGSGSGMMSSGGRENSLGNGPFFPPMDRVSSGGVKEDRAEDNVEKLPISSSAAPAKRARRGVVPTKPRQKLPSVVAQSLRRLRNFRRRLSRGVLRNGGARKWKHGEIRWVPKATTGLRPIVNLRSKNSGFAIRNSVLVLKHAARKQQFLGNSVLNRFELYGKLMEAHYDNTAARRPLRLTVCCGDLRRCYENLPHQEIMAAVHETPLPALARIIYPSQFKLRQDHSILPRGHRHPFVTSEMTTVSTGATPPFARNAGWSSGGPPLGAGRKNRPSPVVRLIGPRVPAGGSSATIQQVRNGLFETFGTTPTTLRMVGLELNNLPGRDENNLAGVGLPQGASGSPLLCSLTLARRERLAAQREAEALQNIGFLQEAGVGGGQQQHCRDVDMVPAGAAPHTHDQLQQPCAGLAQFEEAAGGPSGQRECCPSVEARLIDDLLYIGPDPATAVFARWRRVFGDIHKEQKVEVEYVPLLAAQQAAGDGAHQIGVAQIGGGNAVTLAPGDKQPDDKKDLVWAGFRFRPDLSAGKPRLNVSLQVGMK